jgi:hypothetical protein
MPSINCSLELIVIDYFRGESEHESMSMYTFTASSPLAVP